MPAIGELADGCIWRVDHLRAPAWAGLTWWGPGHGWDVRLCSARAAPFRQQRSVDLGVSRRTPGRCRSCCGSPVCFPPRAASAISGRRVGPAGVHFWPPVQRRATGRTNSVTVGASTSTSALLVLKAPRRKSQASPPDREAAGAGGTEPGPSALVGSRGRVCAGARPATGEGASGNGCHRGGPGGLVGGGPSPDRRRGGRRAGRVAGVPGALGAADSGDHRRGRATGGPLVRGRQAVLLRLRRQSRRTA